jgi:putative cardiolipin synthase
MHLCLSKRVLPLVALLAFAQGCATVDFDYPKTPSHAFLDTDDTTIGRTVAPAQAKRPGQSGFHLIVDGIEAMAARLLLARKAEKSIDAQYYVIHDDIAGQLFLGALLAAAERGVRVRLLIDDIATEGRDAGIAALDAHPKFEIRIYNPFSRRSGKLLEFASDFERVNRRMHNKSFTVDTQATIVGGRNIGAEYFAARSDVNFGDLDLVAFGQVAKDVAAEFDAYWNSKQAVPAAALVEAPEDPATALAELKARNEEALRAIEGTPYAEALDDSLLDYGDFGLKDLHWTAYQVVYDLPGKGGAPRPGGEGQIITPLRAAIGEAQSDFLLVSPYFVPRPNGVEGFRGLRHRGVAVTILTNSLAATDVPPVYAGYADSRAPLLEMDVALYEIRADLANSAAKRAGAASSRSSLHAKAFIVDRQRLFVGSFNWDPRSAFTNTEMGILVDSPEIARFLHDGLIAALPSLAYRLRLAESGDIEWVTETDGQPAVFSHEPDTSFWQRLGTGFTGLLPIEGHL